MSTNCWSILDTSIKWIRTICQYCFRVSNKHIFYVKRKSCNSRPHFKNQLMDNTLLFLKDFFKKVLIIYTLDISTLTCYGKFFSKKKKPVNNYFGVSIKVLFTFYAINYNYTNNSNVCQLFQKINDKSPITFYWEEYIQYETTYILLLQ